MGERSDKAENVHIHKARMAPSPDAAPGLEQDGKGHVIPLSQRTKDDQEKVKSGNKDA